MLVDGYVHCVCLEKQNTLSERWVFTKVLKIYFWEHSSLVQEKMLFLGKINFVTFSLLKGITENQSIYRGTLNRNHVKTMPSTWVSSFILSDESLQSSTWLNLKPSQDSLIKSSLSFARRPSGHVSFLLKMCPDPILHLLPAEEYSLQSETKHEHCSFLLALRMEFHFIFN